MPPSKKVAKRDPIKSSQRRDEGKEFRRAREHRGRVQVLRPSLGQSAGDIDTLMKLAEQELASSHPKDAADLLRAAEHLSFGYLVTPKENEHPHSRLLEGIEEEFRHKLQKAKEHWKEPEVLNALYQKTLNGSQKAFEDGAHHKALELVRAAEAMAHVHLHDVRKE